MFHEMFGLKVKRKHPLHAHQYGQSSENRKARALRLAGPGPLLLNGDGSYGSNRPKPEKVAITMH